MIMKPEALAEIVVNAVAEATELDPRTQQKRAGILGPSDIGFCRNRALLVMSQEPPTNERNMWPARVGTAVGNFVEEKLKMMHPDMIIGSIDQQRVTCTLKNGYESTGTPDVLWPRWNLVADLKSRDGLTMAKRQGANLNEVYQKWLYCKGAAQMGILDPDKPLYVANIFVDRSGREEIPHVIIDGFDPTLEADIVRWVEDVTYARLHGGEPMRDVPATRCQHICEYFDRCRGGFLPDQDGGEIIDDPERAEAALAYEEGRELTKRGDRMMKDAKSVLDGSNGIAVLSDGSRLQVRHTWQNPSTVAGFEKAGHWRIDIRRLEG